MVVFGPGYTAGRLVRWLRADGWHVDGIGRDQSADEPAVRASIAGATHILSSVPPENGRDAILSAHGAAIAGSGAWIGYLSSTGVYGDAGGAWVDESAPLDGRRPERIAADRDWLALGARVFRLPGIYGPGRSMLDRVVADAAHRLDRPGQVFSRIHVDDVVTGVMAGFSGPPGAYNLADDQPASQNAVVETACALLGRPLPPLRGIDEIGLSPAARAFYAENRRVASGRARRLLGWRPRYRDWREGLAAILDASAGPDGRAGDA